jgi:hypothetical protein
VVFNAIERSGIRIDREEFQSRFHPIDGEYVYTQFNFKTLTGRPSNKFKGVNYAALNKENGDRKSFIPRNDIFFLSWILVLIILLFWLTWLVNYDFGEEDIHMAFAEMYGVDYQKAKELTFKQMYGGVLSSIRSWSFLRRFKYILMRCGLAFKMRVQLSVLFQSTFIKKMSLRYETSKIVELCSSKLGDGNECSYIVGDI